MEVSSSGGFSSSDFLEPPFKLLASSSFLFHASFITLFNIFPIRYVNNSRPVLLRFEPLPSYIPPARFRLHCFLQVVSSTPESRAVKQHIFRIFWYTISFRTVQGTVQFKEMPVKNRVICYVLNVWIKLMRPLTF